MQHCACAVRTRRRECGRHHRRRRERGRGCSTHAIRIPAAARALCTATWWLDEWMERVCNTVPVLCAPDGVSVVGTIVVGASVGVAAAHTSASSSLQRRRLLPPTARYPEYPYRPFGTLEYSLVPARTARGRACFLGYPVEYPARPLKCRSRGRRVHRASRETPPRAPHSTRRVPPRVPLERPYRPFIPLRTPLKVPP